MGQLASYDGKTARGAGICGLCAQAESVRANWQLRFRAIPFESVFKLQFVICHGLATKAAPFIDI